MIHKLFILIALLFLSGQKSIAQNRLYIIPSVNQTRSIDLSQSSTEDHLSKMHTGINIRFYSKKIGLDKIPGVLDLGFTFKKHEYMNNLHKWDHGIPGLTFEESTERLVIKRNVLSLSYGLYKSFNDQIKVELGLGLNYSFSQSSYAYPIWINAWADTLTHGTPQYEFITPPVLRQQLNGFIRFGASITPNKRSGFGIGIDYNLLGEKPVDFGITASNNSASATLINTFNPHLLTISFGIFINIYSK